MNNKATRTANGNGSIRKRPDGRWEARYSVGYDPKTGKRINRSIYGKTQREVREQLSKVTTELDEGSYIEPRKETLGEWLDTWLQTYVAISVKPYTYDSYHTICDRHIKPALGRVKLSLLSPIQIQEFYNSLIREKQLSEKTVKNVNGVLHRALKQAVKLQMIARNPVELCDLPKVRRKKISPMEADELKRFLQAIRDMPFEAIYRITLFTGMRQGEVLGLTWDCIDFERNSILVDKQLQKTRKVGGTYALVATKNSRNRTIIAAPSVMRLLKKQRSQQRQQQLLAGPAWDNPWDLVFTNDIGGHLCHVSVYKDFKQIVRDLGMERTRFHDLRHGYAVAALESGDDIKTVQENLGHATASFTLDVYGHVSQKMRQRSAENMERFIESVS